MNINLFWQCVLAQDADAIRAFFREDARIRWHCTNECFSLDEYIVANCEYPGDWDGEIERIEQNADLITTAVRVFPKDRSASFHVVSFIRLVDDKIAFMDEYWADDGPAPRWRQEMHISTPIR